MFFRRSVPGACVVLALSLFSVSIRAQQEVERAPSTDLDAFMEKVLARREIVRRVMNDYILDERETFEILGPGGYRLHRTNREYTWFVREGIHVRSPLRYEGVSIPKRRVSNTKSDGCAARRRGSRGKPNARRPGRRVRRSSPRRRKS